MNIGQILETHLGWAAVKLDFHASSPAFSGVTEEEIQEQMNDFLKDSHHAEFERPISSERRRRILGK